MAFPLSHLGPPPPPSSAMPLAAPPPAPRILRPFSPITMLPTFPPSATFPSPALPPPPASAVPPSYRFALPAMDLHPNLATRGSGDLYPPLTRIDNAFPQAVSSGKDDSVAKLQIEAMDLEKLLLQARELASRAEESATRIASLTNLELGRKVDDVLVPCSYNSFHRMPPEAAFRHSLRCPPRPERFVTDIQNIASSMNYFKTINHAQTSQDGESADASLAMPHCSPKKALLVENRDVFDVWREMLSVLEEQSFFRRSQLFYKDAPAVVQVSRPDYDKVSMIPKFTNIEFKTEYTSEGELTYEICRERWDERRDIAVEGESLDKKAVSKYMRPSRYWLVTKEISSWKEFPTHYSPFVLEAALGLGGIKRKDLKTWLLTQSPIYGLTLDPALTDHVMVLLDFCLHASHREALELYASSRAILRTTEARAKESGIKGNRHVQDCKPDTVISLEGQIQPNKSLREHSGSPNLQRCYILTESGHWLASHLVPLCSPGQSTHLVIGLYKHAFMRAAWELAQPFLDDVISYARNGGKHVLNERKKDVDLKSEDSSKDMYLEDGAMPAAELSSFRTRKGIANDTEIGNEERLGLEVDETISEGRSSLFQIAAAVAALKERVSFNHYNEDAFHSQLPKYQLRAEYLNIMRRAEEERTKRSNIRMVLEHDGLTWHRTQQEEIKNKTREEMLAEERDYKRRRMSYRGKKLKRTPVQVMHDIIETHMGEIIAAGGIGCFTKHLPELLVDREGPEMQASCLPDAVGNEHRTIKPMHEDGLYLERRLGDYSLMEQRQRMDLQGQTLKRVSYRASNEDFRHRSSGSPECQSNAVHCGRESSNAKAVSEKNLYEDIHSPGRRHHSRSRGRDRNDSANPEHHYRDRYERWDCSSSEDQCGKLAQYDRLARRREREPREMGSRI